MKDAKGHGSEARGGEGPHRKSSHVKQLERLGLAGRGSGKFDETYGLKGGTPMGDPARPGATFGGQPVESNAHAAATLASGAKSAPVDTHSAMGPKLGTPEYQAGLLRDAQSLGASMKAKGQARTSMPGASPELKSAYLTGYRSKRDRSAAHNAGPNGLVRSNKPYRGIGS